MECIRLRVKDIAFDHRAIFVRAGKGAKDRVVTLPDALLIPLQRHLSSVKNTHEKDLADGYGQVWLPHALARRYPRAPAEWGWQYVFPASRRSIDPRSGVVRRHHFDESSIQRAVKIAIRQADINKAGKANSQASRTSWFADWRLVGVMAVKKDSRDYRQYPDRFSAPQHPAPVARPRRCAAVERRSETAW